MTTLPTTKQATATPAAAPCGIAAELEQQITRTRRARLRFGVRDEHGHSVAGTKVSYRQLAHQYLFGCAISGDLDSTDSDEVRYRQFIRKRFNCLTHEDALKWYSIEKQAGERRYADAERVFEYARRNQMQVRGHCLLWDREKFVSRQPWLQTLTEHELRDAVRRHVSQTTQRFRGQVVGWDVVNEMLDPSAGWYGQKLGEGIYRDIFALAAEHDPGTPLFVNEWGVLGNPTETQRMIDLVKRLQDAGANVGGIGLQEHACQRILPEDEPTPASLKHPRITPEQVCESLDRLAELGLPIHLTEISSQSDDPRLRAAGLTWILRLSFAHPAVDAITLWGFWARRHWLGDTAAMIDGQWQSTAAGNALDHLLLERWRSRGDLKTNRDGQAAFTGFAGRYELLITTPDGQQHRRVTELDGEPVDLVL